MRKRVERFDVIVVGAGPAGSVTATRLARGGARVLLLDKARFPRDKPCGGGLTMRAVNELPVSVEPVVEHVVDRIGLRLDYGTRVERRGRAPLVLMTQRIRLDEHLAHQAAAAGADFRDGVKVTDIVADDAGASVHVDGRQVEADALVGADGVNGPVRKSLGLGGEYVLGVALEANVANEVVGERYKGIAELELGIIPGGYAWVFPKGDHVNVGVGGWESEGPTLRGQLAELCRQHGIASEAVESIRGHRLPLRKPGSISARGRALLVGDAAGLVDPLSGDGMYEAFVSARLASEAVLELLEGTIGCTGLVLDGAGGVARVARVCFVGRQGRARPLPTRDVRARPLGARVARDGAHAARGDPGAVAGARADESAPEGDRGTRAARR